MIVEEIEYISPPDVAGVVSALAAHGEGAKILAGGMSLVPMMNLGLARPDVVISLSRVSELRFVTDEDGLRIGGMARHCDLARSDAVRRHAPTLAEAASVIGDVQVRNRGTIGGSLAHGDPAADYLPVLIAQGARCQAVSASGSRWIAVADLVIDVMQTCLRPGEVLVAVEVPLLPGGGASAFARFVRVEGNYAIVTAAAVATAGHVRVVVGGATTTPVVVESVAGDPALAADEITARIDELTEDAYGDVAGDSEYRRAMAGVFGRRVAVRALEARKPEGERG